MSLSFAPRLDEVPLCNLQGTGNKHQAYGAMHMVPCMVHGTICIWSETMWLIDPLFYDASTAKLLTVSY